MEHPLMRQVTLLPGTLPTLIKPGKTVALELLPKGWEPSLFEQTFVVECCGMTQTCSQGRGQSLSLTWWLITGPGTPKLSNMT